MGEEYVRRVMVLGQVPSLGPVILFDDMEDLFKWSKSGTGGDDVCEKDTADAYNGSACMRVKTRTTGAAGDDIVTATRYCTERPGRRYRFECLFKLTAYQNAKYTRFRIEGDDMSNYFVAELVFDRATRSWYRLVENNSLVFIDDSFQYLVDGAWHRLLFEIDLNSGEYIRMECDQISLSMGDLRFYKTTTSDASFFKTEVELQAYSTSPPEIRVDDVLVMEI